jgi:nitrate/nitrite-specific signal transduction histidine kinase
MTNSFQRSASQVDQRQHDATASSCSAATSCDGKLRALEADREHLNQKLLEMQTEQQHLLERYVGLEEQNSALTTLYVACQRLHSSLDREEVLQTVREVVANLVGCEEYVLFSMAPDGWLRRVDSFGVNPEAYERVLPGNGLIGRAVETGEAYLSGECDPSIAIQIDKNLTACIPLKRNGVVTGAIALFRLLPQKFELQELDRELFWLIESHLAQALYCADLHQRANARIGVTA